MRSSWGLVLLVAAALAGCASGGAGRVPAPLPSIAEEAVTLQTPAGVVYGTLLSPVVSSLRPVAVIIAGSGPTDRNGNSAGLTGDNNSLRMLAEALAVRGIATLRYDKRGIAQSAPAGAREEDLRFRDYAADAAAWVEQLRRNPRFSSVSIIGHSEGALIGALAADQAEVQSFLSIAGVGRRASTVLRGQLRPQLPPALWEQSERILGELEAGRTTGDVPPELLALYRPSVQPYLISWFEVDPVRAISALDMPVMIAQGTTDIQVGVADAAALHAAKSDARLVIVNGMNHILKLVPADQAQQIASYSNPDLPIVPELVDSIAAFIRSADDR